VRRARSGVRHDCNAGSRELRNGKWLFLLGRGPGGALAKLGQVMVVGHRTGDVELDMLDPEGITRFEMKGRSYLVIVDGGLKGGSVRRVPRRAALCLPLSLGPVAPSMPPPRQPVPRATPRRRAPRAPTLRVAARAGGFRHLARGPAATR
jgi:hypothetical protein